MLIYEKQKELDVKKWLESENAARDLCGDFDFCSKCDKDIENPCAVAYDEYNKQKTKKRCKKSCAK